MDVSAFLKDRTSFIRQLYDNSSKPFEQVKLKIENEEAPFIPVYSEDPEPAFLKEWLEANDSIKVLGLMALSMLSTSLHLYFETWQKQWGYILTDKHKFQFKKNGWFNGYKYFFKDVFEIDFNEAPSNLGKFQELVLARNCIQHPNNITSNSIRYGKADTEKILSPFFVTKNEVNLTIDFDGVEKWAFSPEIIVTRELLDSTIEDLNKFCDWLENEITIKRVHIIAFRRPK